MLWEQGLSPALGGAGLESLEATSTPVSHIHAHSASCGAVQFYLLSTASSGALVPTEGGVRSLGPSPWTWRRTRAFCSSWSRKRKGHSIRSQRGWFRSQGHPSPCLCLQVGALTYLSFIQQIVIKPLEQQRLLFVVAVWTAVT